MRVLSVGWFVSGVMVAAEQVTTSTLTTVLVALLGGGAVTFALAWLRERRKDSVDLTVEVGKLQAQTVESMQASMNAVTQVQSQMEEIRRAAAAETAELRRELTETRERLYAAEAKVAQLEHELELSRKDRTDVMTKLLEATTERDRWQRQSQSLAERIAQLEQAGKQSRGP